MRRAFQYAPYAVVVLAVLSLVGWFRAEQHRLEHESDNTFHFEEPEWANHLADIRAAVRQQPSEEAKLVTLANLMTAPYRQQNLPLRFKVIHTDDGTLVLRLNAAVVVPRWYTARAARLAHSEAQRLIGREVPIHIYETYIVGRSRLIGIYRARNGTVEVAFR